MCCIIFAFHENNKICTINYVYKRTKNNRTLKTKILFIIKEHLYTFLKQK